MKNYRKSTGKAAYALCTECFIYRLIHCRLSCACK